MPRSGTQKKQGQLVVRFFGKFQITAAGRVINEASSRSRRPWSLLQYLMILRHKNPSRQQLIEALWPDGSSEQPEKALKNLVYRIRSQFSALGVPFAQDIILYSNGNYQLNNELDWDMDFERFDALCTRAAEPGLSDAQRIALYREAIDLYRGDFLTEHVYEDWVLSFNTYYRSQYYKCIDRVFPLLEEAGQYDEMEYISNQALMIDRFEESLHIAYMQALVRQGKGAAAASHYNYMADMFFRELGVTPCQELRDMYRALSNTADFVQTDLQSIKEKLDEAEMTHDAFYCDFETFRNLYRLEARSAERSGQSVFIGLLTLVEEDGNVPEQTLLDKAMEHLLDTVHGSLRRGDVVSRYSLAQYILMLPTVTVENGEMVLNRIAKRFSKTSPFNGIRLDSRIQPLDPKPA